jgi:hypothetical protein
MGIKQRFVKRAGTITVAIALSACASAAKNVNVQDPVLNRIGDMAPEIRLKTLDGADAALADYRGKIVVLHFGASW